MGICGGAYLAGTEVIWQGRVLSMESLGLYEGTARGPWDAIAPYPGYGLCVQRFTDSSHPITRDLATSLLVLYYWGPSLTPRVETPGMVLARYEATGEAAILALTFERGRVFLVGTHPEIEENSDRDGQGFASELTDPDSEWDLLRNATRWCLGEILEGPSVLSEDEDGGGARSAASRPEVTARLRLPGAGSSGPFAEGRARSQGHVCTQVCQDPASSRAAGLCSRLRAGDGDE
jgi:hypothetical protein